MPAATVGYLAACLDIYREVERNVSERNLEECTDQTHHMHLVNTASSGGLDIAVKNITSLRYPRLITS